MQTILITGASSGIGRAVVEQLASHDVKLLLVGRNHEKLQQLAKTISCPTQLILLDLTDLEAVKKIPSCYKINCLINCAGVGEVGDFQELDLSDELAEIATNFLAPMILAKGYAQQFVKSGQGTIVNVCSTASLYPHPYLTNYGASKAALWHYSLGLTEELRAYPDIRVVTICPGPTKTAFFQGKMRATIQESSFQMTAEKVAQIIEKRLSSKKNYQIIGYRNWWLTQLLFWLPRNVRLKIVGNYIKKGRV